MKQDQGDRMSRLRDRPPGGAALEDRAAALLRGLQPCDEPSELQMAQIEEGIGTRSSHRTRPSLTFRVALAVFAFLAGVASVKAYELARRAGWLERIHLVASPPEEPARPQPSKRPIRATAPLPPAATLDQAPSAKEPVALGADPIPETVAGEPPRRQARATRHVAVIEAPAYAPAPKAETRNPFEPAPTAPWVGQSAQGVAVPPSAPAQKLATPVPSPAPSTEIHALDGAIALLRRDHDAAAALSALDAYLARYPHGVLHREARLARLDALLILKHTEEALAELESLPLDAGRRSTELQVVRAELRARTDCLRAEEDFSVALTHSPDAALLERILYGRGACRAKLGKASGATEDLRRYLERFPNGAHAAWARQWLETISKSSVQGG